MGCKALFFYIFLDVKDSVCGIFQGILRQGVGHQQVCFPADLSYFLLFLKVVLCKKSWLGLALEAEL